MKALVAYCGQNRILIILFFSNKRKKKYEYESNLIWLTETEFPFKTQIFFKSVLAWNESKDKNMWGVINNRDQFQFNHKFKSYLFLVSLFNIHLPCDCEVRTENCFRAERPSIKTGVSFKHGEALLSSNLIGLKNWDSSSRKRFFLNVY